MDGIEIDLNNIPEDPTEALKLLEQIERGGEPVAAAPAAAAPQPAAPAAQPVVVEPQAASVPVKETQTPTETAEAEAAGVATKDGKHVIPYSVLQSEREQKVRANTLLQEMTQRVTALEQSLQAAAKGANTGAAPRAAEAVAADAPAMSDADLEALKEDFPTVYKALKATMAHAASLEAQVREQANFRQEVEGASQRDVEMTVQEAIDSVPKLAHIQAADPATFALAQQFDDTLKNTPAWASKPMQERFAKVIEMVEAANGAIDLPGGKSTPEVPAPNAEDLKKQAQAAAAAAAKATKTNVPTSLSEFPVGNPAAETESQALENMTHAQLAEKLGRMTPAQQEAYFATL
jgi:hypothetical protein